MRISRIVIGILFLLSLLFVLHQALQAQSLSEEQPEFEKTDIISDNITKMAMISIGLIAILIALFVFTLPYIEDPKEHLPFWVEHRVFIFTVVYEFKNGLLFFFAMILLVDLLSVLSERLNSLIIVNATQLLLVLVAFLFASLVIACFRDLPPRVKRVIARHMLQDMRRR